MRVVTVGYIVSNGSTLAFLRRLRNALTYVWKCDFSERYVGGLRHPVMGIRKCATFAQTAKSGMRELRNPDPIIPFNFRQIRFWPVQSV